MNASENRVLDGIKDVQIEYPDGVPISVLKTDLGLSDDDLRVTLLSLEDEGVIFIEEDYVKLVDQVSDNRVLDDDIKAVGKRITTTESSVIEEDVLKDLSETELKTFRVIEGLVDDSGNVSKYILEGNILYGDLRLTTLSAFNLITSLESKGLIRRIHLNDGDYYRIG